MKLSTSETLRFYSDLLAILAIAIQVYYFVLSISTGNLARATLSGITAFAVLLLLLISKHA